MNDLLQSLRSDLLSRRMLPLVVLALLALVGALGYALGGGSAAGPVPHAASAGGAGAQQAALALAAASPNPNAAEAETPGGVRYQSHGPLRNPFAPLPGSASSGKSSSAVLATSTASGEARGQSGGGTSSPGKSGGGEVAPPGKSGGGEAPTPAKPNKPSKKGKFPYDVSVLFGKLPATPGQEVTLPPYQGLTPKQPLPSAADARIAFERVNGNAKSAVFTLLEPAILRGAGVCLPSASECEQLALETGAAAELEYIEESGQTVVYELKTVSIVKSSSQVAG